MYRLHLYCYTSDRVEEKLSKVQATYGGGSCFLLKINSRLPGSIVLGDNPWSRVARHYTTLHNSNGEVIHYRLGREYECSYKEYIILSTMNSIKGVVGTTVSVVKYKGSNNA